MTSAAELRGIRRRFGAGPPALDGVDLDLRAGEVHALLGENGAGKTTLMRILAGLDAPDAGTVAVGGSPVTEFTPRALRDRVLDVLLRAGDGRGPAHRAHVGLLVERVADS